MKVTITIDSTTEITTTSARTGQLASTSRSNIVSIVEIEVKAEEDFNALPSLFAEHSNFHKEQYLCQNED